MYFFTADEHYGHTNIIRYCNRPFGSIDEMNRELIKRHNEVVCKDDRVVHAGDFTLHNRKTAHLYISQFNGQHIFLSGSHDRWLKGERFIWEKKIEGQYVIVCHYAMRTWPKSHYGSWQLYGHSHGKLTPERFQYDIGVDNNDFYPVSFEQLKRILE